MFEAETFGVNINVPHLVMAVFVLPIATTYVLDRAARLKLVVAAGHGSRTTSHVSLFFGAYVLFFGADFSADASGEKGFQKKDGLDGFDVPVLILA